MGNFLKNHWDIAVAATFAVSYATSHFFDASVPEDPFTAQWSPDEIGITATALVAASCLINQIYRLGVGTHKIWQLRPSR
ncbi:MAG: hypothetical protein AAF988_04660 [Pseudomonadota bacterium]